MLNAFFIIFYIFVSLLFIIFLAQLFLSIPRKYRITYHGNPGFKTLVIVPCRGIDFGLAENLASITHQEYENYKVMAVVDSEDDLAVPAIRDTGIEYMISSCESKGSGKVRAIASAIMKFPDFDAYVIADSDILAPKNWLNSLLQPLIHEKYGLSTTFPYFSPEGGFWSHFKTAWGLVGQGMMESDITVFGWGGSLAFRKELLEDEYSLEDFASDVSDDMALTRICKRKSMKIAYVKEATVNIRSPDDWPVFREWSLRQTSLLVSRNRIALKIGLLMYGSESMLMVFSVILSLVYSPFFAIFLLPAWINVIKSILRIRERKAVYVLIGLVMPFFYTWNLAVASHTQEISWRGRKYSLLEFSDPVEKNKS